MTVTGNAVRCLFFDKYFYAVFGSLVQRELSAKLTEGLFHLIVNIFANTVEILIHLIVWYS